MRLFQTTSRLPLSLALACLALAAVAGARISLLGLDSVKVVNQTNYGFSDQRGRFRISGVISGAYRIRVEASGFSAFVSDSLIVRSGITIPNEVLLSPRSP